MRNCSRRLSLTIRDVTCGDGAAEPAIGDRDPRTLVRQKAWLPATEIQLPTGP
jgi:hypothetical protein